MIEYKITDVQISLLIKRIGVLPWANVDPIMQIIREVINNGKSEQQARIDQDKLKDIAKAVDDTV